MSDEEVSESADATEPEVVPESAVQEPERSGVHVPTWVAAVTAVVLAFLIGVAGFAIGQSSADDGGPGRPGIMQGGPAGAHGPGSQRGGQSGQGGQNGPRGQLPSQGQGGPGGQGGSGYPGSQGGSDQLPSQGGPTQSGTGSSGT